MSEQEFFFTTKGDFSQRSRVLCYVRRRDETLRAFYRWSMTPDRQRSGCLPRKPRRVDAGYIAQNSLLSFFEL
jgi:hypothetical protein